ncbi:MAG: MaoC family dehydratase [Actinobacteria bacterium]|nr:MaoC family dehydratase [Actinomycetota bacterium]
MAGRWYDELEPGLVVHHAITRTVTEMDNVMFSCLTMNPQPLHLDAHFAAQTEFGRPLVNSLFTLGLVVGIAVPELTLGTTVANLGFEEVRFPTPIFAGDTVSVETEVLARRESKSRPDDGVVTFRHTAHNQNGDVVCIATRNALMRKQPAAAAGST